MAASPLAFFAPDLPADGGFMYANNLGYFCLTETCFHKRANMVSLVLDKLCVSSHERCFDFVVRVVLILPLLTALTLSK